MKMMNQIAMTELFTCFSYKYPLPSHMYPPQPFAEYYYGNNRRTSSKTEMDNLLKLILKTHYTTLMVFRKSMTGDLLWLL